MMTLKKSTQLFFLTSFVILIGTQASALAQLPNGWKAHDKNRPQPKVVSPGEQANQAPSDATVLLGGKELTHWTCLLYTSPSPRDQRGSRMPSSA